MVIFKCDHGEVASMATGSIIELTADVLTMVSSIYASLWEKDTISATLFRDMVEDNIKHAFELKKEDKEDE